MYKSVNLSKCPCGGPPAQPRFRSCHFPKETCLPICLPSSSHCWPSATTYLLPIFRVLPLLEDSINGIKQCVVFCGWLPSPNSMFWDSHLLQHTSRAQLGHCWAKPTAQKQTICLATCLLQLIKYIHPTKWQDLLAWSQKQNEKPWHISKIFWSHNVWKYVMRIQFVPWNFVWVGSVFK